MSIKPATQPKDDAFLRSCQLLAGDLLFVWNVTSRHCSSAGDRFIFRPDTSSFVHFSQKLLSKSYNLDASTGQKRSEKATKVSTKTTLNDLRKARTKDQEHVLKSLNFLKQNTKKNRPFFIKLHTY